jgi:hypothetical protein
MTVEILKPFRASVNLSSTIDLLVTQFYQAAMARIDVPEEERVDFHLVIDEVQSFSTESFSKALAEVRKMRLSVTAGNQYIAQLSDSLKHAIFGNVGTFISFRVGAKDAEALATEFGYTYRPETFTDLSNHEICAKLLQHGEEQEPFLGRTFAPNFTRYHRNEKIIQRSRERYTTPRAVSWRHWHAPATAAPRQYPPRSAVSSWPLWPAANAHRSRAYHS